MTERTFNRWFGILMIAGGILLIFMTSACATMAQNDYIQTPPEEYQKSRPVMVEFLPPEKVTLRCIQRGLLIPAYACGNTDFITMPNPCAFPDDYARLQCHELARANGWGTQPN